MRFLHFTQKYKKAAKNGGKTIFGKSRQFTLQIPLEFKNFAEIALTRTVSEIYAFSHFTQTSRWLPIMAGKQFLGKIANLINQLNFYKLITYPMDKCYSSRRRPARQTSEKDVLCLHRPAGP